MTQLEQQDSESDSADMVQIATGEDRERVDELEDVVDRMLPVDESTSEVENPATYPHAEALDQLELEPDSASEPAVEPLPDAGSSPDHELSARSGSVTTEELDELMLVGQELVREDAVLVVDEIARISEAFEAMRESAIDQIKAALAVATGQQAGISESVDSILGEFRSLRQEMDETGRAVRASLDAAQRAGDGVRDLGDRFSLANQVRTEVGSIAKPLRTMPVVYLGGAVILLSWAIAFWVRTGDLMIAMAGVVLANVAVCGVLLSTRRGE